MQAYRRLPFWLKVVAAVAVIPLAAPILLAALVYGAVAVVQGRRTAGASIAVALWGLVVFALAAKGDRTWLYSVILLPFGVALAAHARLLARSFVPCRTVAWVLVWSVPAGLIAFKAAQDQPFIGTIAAWLLAAAVLGWRVAKGIQDNRMYGGRTADSPRGPRGPYGPGDQGGPPRTAGSTVNPQGQPHGRPGGPGQGVRAHGAQSTAPPYGDNARDQSAPARPRPQISV
ncbi:MAG TPA: hypothetical protein VFQ68_02385, partial [Streptosporangiaceae bacterium]|nr:hypothetical protein [Streptosporangiaceae bacterium]